ncbi:MAG: hypothetical protein R2720_07550 [Candidatus Nanopelagicales bacterium]
MELPDLRNASGRLRFSITAAEQHDDFRLMVLDCDGRVQLRMPVAVQPPRTPVQLTGFPRGELFLVCAFMGDDLIWSAPVQAG